MDGFLAQILLFAGDFAPRGWAFCRGQLLPISQHQTLFAVIGTRYGGDGKVSFALPDLRGRPPTGSAPARADPPRRCVPSTAEATTAGPGGRVRDLPRGLVPEAAVMLTLGAVA